MYWAASQPYHAFGLGAASLVGARRFARPRSMRAYRAWVEGFLAAGGGVPGASFGMNGCLTMGVVQGRIVRVTLWSSAASSCSRSYSSAGMRSDVTRRMQVPISRRTARMSSCWTM